MSRHVTTITTVCLVIVSPNNRESADVVSEKYANYVTAQRMPAVLDTAGTRRAYVPMTTTSGAGPGMFLYEVEDGRGGRRGRRGHRVGERAGGRHRRRRPHKTVARHRQPGHHAHRHRLRLLLCKQRNVNTQYASYETFPDRT